MKHAGSAAENILGILAMILIGLTPIFAMHNIIDGAFSGIAGIAHRQSKLFGQSLA